MKGEIIDAFAQMAKQKNIDRDILESVINDSFRKMMEKKYGTEANFEINVNMEKGNIEIFHYKTVVEVVNDPNTEIDVETAKEKSGEDFSPGDDFVEELPIEEFGRRLVLNLKQNLNQKLREIEKEVTFNYYKELVGEIIVGEVYQIKSNSMLLIHNGNEVIFPKSEQIQNERFRKGETVRAIVKSVEKKSSGPPTIIVSRTDNEFLQKLFELEIPEIYDNIIEIRSIAREPGERAKISVFSNDDRIDAVGACVGMKGSRIHSIVRELNNENIDVINYTDDNALYIARSLAPAKIEEIILDSANKTARIKADEDQISLIIGKSGQNIKLASKLTGFQLDVIREEKKNLHQDIMPDSDEEMEVETDDELDEDLDENEETEIEENEETEIEENEETEIEENEETEIEENEETEPGLTEGENAPEEDSSEEDSSEEDSSEEDAEEKTDANEEEKEEKEEGEKGKKKTGERIAKAKKKK